VKNSPESSKESTAVQIGQGSGPGLESTSQTEHQTTQRDGLASTEVITTGTGEAGTEEGTAGEHGDNQATVYELGYRIHAELNTTMGNSPLGRVGSKFGNERVTHNDLCNNTEII
jgi:hypothetical protein